MIIAIDTETIGLDATKFRLGAIVIPGKNPEVYDNKQKMKERIKQIGETEKKRGHRVYVYGHNIEYDVYALDFHKDKEMKYFCTSPFIAEYENLQFVDTMGLYRGSLKKMGETIELPKMEMPVETMEKKKLTQQEWNTMAEYCIRDTQIVLKGVNMIKNKLEEDGIKTRRLLTAGQIAINYLTNAIRQKNYKD